ncbi:flagellar basal body rod protein FlgB [Alkalicoccus daliensis]|uniref:Flagellar basal body rod protein FlgB n=1 Tax=Alkalicoccus daliensis TaxID=745820 RepID=A0A1H0A330_9BACI|nr:flagellar basal body rod protein FlgB [Alkalicoccus daliensis]SDN27797.1 flagellar basal-body rod protein FlgB [Alkalicoccus daliensis]
MNLINNERMNLLEQSLNAAVSRQNTTASNIANADTPGYKAQKTIFQHQLEAASNQLNAHRTNEKHIQFSGGSNNGEPTVIQKNNTMYNHNENNVDIDHEMSEMAKNQIYYNSLIERLNGSFNSIRTALGSGR